MNPCECTKLTGECQHDCPKCGGEGILPESKDSIPPRKATEPIIRYCMHGQYALGECPQCFNHKWRT